ncbi:MAG: Rossmann fold nucleotide-binding protein Smf [Labilithrix sp.]|nr:Rossmann fold nucleotide-binding protein Smf [Labilithrix sp.]
MSDRTVRYTFDDPGYPDALKRIPNPPPVVTLRAPLPARRAVAIAGARSATAESIAAAETIATALAKAGIVVVSGGAIGVDAAAHRAAMAAGGATWVVAPSGRARVVPPRHRELFEAVAASEDSRMIWPFEDDAEVDTRNFIYRNSLLVGLSEAVVVIQARLKSGSRNTVLWGHSFRRPVWVTTSRFGDLRFAGSVLDVELGKAKALGSLDQLTRSLGLGPELNRRDRKCAPASKSRTVLATPPGPLFTASWSEQEKEVFSVTSATPEHIDEIADRTTLNAASAVTALLTLSLKDVVVEGPDGFFRRTSVT